MIIFLSWSGQRSKAIAEGLRSWLPKVLEGVKPFVSTSDIAAGVQFPAALQDKLEEANFGILCLTPDNCRAPWILFEAGALGKALREGRVCPYIIEMEASELDPPLSFYQANVADKAGTFALVKAIADAMASVKTKERLDRSFELRWPELEQRLAELNVLRLSPAQIQYFFVINKKTGCCMHASQRGKDGAPIRLETYKNTDHQKWAFRVVGEDELAIISKYSGLCVDVEKGSGESGGKVHQWTFKGKDNQVWRLEPEQRGEIGVRLKVEHTEFYLTAEGRNAVQQEDDEGDDRLWILRPSF